MKHQERSQETEDSATISNGIWMSEEMDVSHKTFTRAHGQIQDALACYRKVCNEKRNKLHSQNLVSS